MGVLDELLHLKAWREGKAERALADGRAALAESARMAEQADAALADYRDWSARHEQSLYADVCSRAVRPRELEYLREDVAVLRVREAELDDLRLRAQRRREESEAALGSVREAHRQAVKAREKFERLADLQAEEHRVDAERAEDAEAEDRAPVRREFGEEAEHG
jgi:type III secretion protein O